MKRNKKTLFLTGLFLSLSLLSLGCFLVIGAEAFDSRSKSFAKILNYLSENKTIFSVDDVNFDVSKDETGVKRISLSVTDLNVNPDDEFLALLMEGSNPDLIELASIILITDGFLKKIGYQDGLADIRPSINLVGSSTDDTVTLEKFELDVPDFGKFSFGFSLKGYQVFLTTLLKEILLKEILSSEELKELLSEADLPFNLDETSDERVSLLQILDSVFVTKIHVEYNDESFLEKIRTSFPQVFDIEDGLLSLLESFTIKDEHLELGGPVQLVFGARNSLIDFLNDKKNLLWDFKPEEPVSFLEILSFFNSYE